MPEKQCIIDSDEKYKQQKNDSINLFGYLLTHFIPTSNLVVTY